MELSMAPPRQRVNEEVSPGVPDKATLRACETVGYSNWLELAAIRL